MKSIIKNTIYAGLGLLSDGTDAVRSLGRELARKADVSEAEGEKIARKLQVNSSKAIQSIRKALDTEVTKLADAIHSTIRKDVQSKKSKRSKRASAARASSKKRTKGSSRKVAKATRTRRKVV